MTESINPTDLANILSSKKTRKIFLLTLLVANNKEWRSGWKVEDFERLLATIDGLADIFQVEPEQLIEAIGDLKYVVNAN
jgi:hypothetical protein